MKNIPNLFTLLNLFFGCLAIVFVLQNGIVIHYDFDGSQFVDIPEKIWMASLFIGLAGVIDFLDGFVARLLNASSEMGKQLDSLADVVSFGVAPSMIVYQFLRRSFAAAEGGIEVSLILLMPAFIIAMAAAYRLAKFNLDTTQSKVFKGMPTPAVGLFIASFPLIYWTCGYEQVYFLLINKWFWYAMIISVSWLMVSNIPMFSLKINLKNRQELIPLVLLFVIGIVSCIFFKWIAVPILFVSYIILSLLNKKKLS
ncbi:MAG: CDP-diacylglycerol--serine O-phosphatidyltransferase [Sphingobacteriales bacterium]|nr:CDP-diacylglycerol--serine O-phosphatidyltransferase [Sphingobacteriales bacterium]